MFEKVTIVIGATDESSSLVKIVESIADACDISDIESVLIVIPANAEKQCVDTIALLEEKYPSLVKHFVQRNPYIGGALRDSVEQFSISVPFLLCREILIPIFLSDLRVFRL